MPAVEFRTRLDFEQICLFLDGDDLIVKMITDAVGELVFPSDNGVTV